MKKFRIGSGLQNFHIRAPLACTRKKIFGWKCGFFVSDVLSGGILGHFAPLHLALGTKPLDGTISLKFLLEIRPQ